jgi:signal transduction histidine kinase
MTSSVPNADVLGFALDSSSSLRGGRPEIIDGFPLLDEDFLLQLTRKYPNGTIWLFREDGSLSTSTDKEAADACSVSNSGSSHKKYDFEPMKAEAATLQDAMPRARQILFVPVFDAELSRATAGCFAFTTDFTRIVPAEAELGFIKSFVNSVGAQVARINAIAANKSKNAFIGSISHELRSPLHGILAAAEFLEDTKIDSYQKSLINTQVCCGKTLLQVIEHVLDYAKINSFEKDEQAASQHGEPLSSDRIHFGSKMQNLYVSTDIAELCEEVMEGSVAGKSHMQSDVGIAGSSAQAFVRRDQGEGLSNPKAQQDHIFGFNQNVAVILDFDYQKDWNYVTQPGALRRILMNVLGNSLKYTASGCICVRLGVENFDDPIGELSSIMSLSVSDTGRGISHDFLREKLFNPFSQEDYLSTGCGLGLSIVKSLVNTLKGNLEVQSEQGVCDHKV